MGTSGSYSGSGGRAGRGLRRAIRHWLQGHSASTSQDDSPVVQSRHQLPIRTVSRAIGLFRSSEPSGLGGGGAGVGTLSGGRVGGAQRTAARSAHTAGRAAAAAYAYRTGNREELSELGLDYDKMRSLDDPLELSRMIVEAACGPRSESTIDHEEQRWVAAELAEWVLEGQETGGLPQSEEIARKAIALIVFEAIASEVGELINGGERSDWADLDREIRDAADVLSQQAELSVDGVTNAEFSRAIEQGIETLRDIYGVGG